MCGIAGIMSFEGHSIPRDLLDAMTDAEVHRGPDDRGTYISEDARIGLGSRRLSIIDLSVAGNMPMSNETADVWVTFNGEIYNFQKLRNSLVKKGHCFKSVTDTEVLVHLYEELGPAFVKEIDGMFAIALWDAKLKRLVLARDRLGEKPLYMAAHDGFFRFASEIKAIVVDRSLRRLISPEALSQYLTFGFVQPPLTMFAGITKLAPGQIMIVLSDGSSTVSNYWSPAPTPEELDDARCLPIETHVRNVRASLERAVDACLIADVPIGAFLSGGVDSSAVVALMARKLGRGIDAVTMQYPGHADIDESEFAQQVADRAGARLHRVRITENDAIEAFGECVFHLDEPISDPACINTYIGSRYLRSIGVPVALIGEGADELFLGYPFYFRHRRIAPLWSARRVVPAAVRSVLYASVEPMMNPLGLGRHRDLLRRVTSSESLFLSSEPFFPDSDKLAITGHSIAGVVKRIPSTTVTEAVLAEANGAFKGDILAQMGFTEMRMRMAEKLLMRVDKLSMAHSVEVRAPYLDHRLARLALSLPSAIRAPSGDPKALLKRAVADLLPAASLARPKMGFATPVPHWFRGRLGNYLRQMLETSVLVTSGLLSKAAVTQLLDEHNGGRVSHHTKLWNLLCLVEWANRFEIAGIAQSVPATAA